MAVHRVILLQIILFVWPIKASKQLLCQDFCGNLSINYPFGIGEGCYFDKSFEVICDNSSGGSPKAFLNSTKLELTSRMYQGSLIGVNVPVIYSNKTTSNGKGVNLSGSPFSFPRSQNRFAAIDCDNFAIINNVNSNISAIWECLSICTCDPTQSFKNGSCCDFLCTFPNNSNVFDANTVYNYYQSIPLECTTFFIVNREWLYTQYQTNFSVLREQKQVPAVLEWGKSKGNCLADFKSANKICNLDDYCLIQLGSGHFCHCNDRRSNSYQDVCEGFLICNTTSGYNCSECPNGYYLDHAYSVQEPQCSSSRTFGPLFVRKSRDKFIIIGCTSGGFGMLFLIMGAWWLNKIVRKRREMKLNQKFFKRNGGLLLQQELSSTDSNIEKTKVFTRKELERATDNFNTNRILGQGGQGTVYKAMLEDGRIVAVKKSKVIDGSKVEEFINEVVILSQINHRNVVKLFGCCLETEVPLLVYEFIPNGNLYQYLHDQSQEFPITWEMRLRIAVEVSGALSYLHSATSIPIYHRDIKSTNILLDDKYRAKISDFGASRSMAVDQTHMTTQVHGTFGYLDPEYFRSSRFTEKSDVYSFGVVLAELLTGEKPIRSIDSDEDTSLAAYFLYAMKENRLFEILDARVLKEGGKDEIIRVAILTKRCLNLKGKKRPTMKELAIELAGIRAWNNGASIKEEILHEIDCAEVDTASSSYFEITGFSSFARSESFFDSATFSVDADPLISN